MAPRGRFAGGLGRARAGTPAGTRPVAGAARRTRRLDSTYIGGIERGQRNPTLNALYRLTRALDISLPDLVADLRQPRAPTIRPGRPPKRKPTRSSCA